MSTKDWIIELCPEINEWQAQLIAEHMRASVLEEREACALLCERMARKVNGDIRAAALEMAAEYIRARAAE